MRPFQEEFITRHRDLISPEQLATRIVVVGAGAIGSFTVLALAKMGFSNLTVYDFDTVEPENIGNQFFPTDAIGKNKAIALAEMVYKFTGIHIAAVDKKIESSDMLKGDILISAVDNMAVRRMLFESCCACKYIIDPRMAAEYANMRVTDMLSKSDREAYEKTLFSDTEALAERCTAKTTIYTVLLIAGQIVKAVKDVTGETTFIRSLDWNINRNAMFAWGSNGEKL